MRIFIDPGNGGADTGPVYRNSNLKASIINLDVALRCAEFLRIESFAVETSRKSDTALSPQQRASAANDWRADVFVSIHTNADRNPATNGSECLHSPGSALGGELAWYTVDSLTEYNGLRCRGANPSTSGLLRLATMPAIIVQLACLTNPAEAELLARSDFRAKCAYGIATGVKIYFGKN